MTRWAEWEHSRIAEGHIGKLWCLRAWAGQGAEDEASSEMGQSRWWTRPVVSTWNPPLTSCSHFSGGGTWLSLEMTLALCCRHGEVASQRSAADSPR